MMATIEIIRGDITTQQVDAIVNAANTSLLGGGGVDGAIHRAAGPQLLEECKSLGGCETGQARITDGYNLPAKKIIHTVGPIWAGGTQNEPELLANCYRNSLKIAAINNLKSIAFPAISCGVYRYPLSQAAQISIKTVREHSQNHDLPEIIRWVMFDETVYDVWREAYESIFSD